MAEGVSERNLPMLEGQSTMDKTAMNMMTPKPPRPEKTMTISMQSSGN